jgi:hypothetical protein
MSGVEIAGTIVSADSDVLAVVPADNMHGGALPIGTALPALVFNTISTTTLAVLSKGAKRRMRERVQVTVFAADYEAQKAIAPLLRRALDHVAGDIAGLTEVSIVAAGEGADFIVEDPMMWCQTHDFMVDFNEVA